MSQMSENNFFFLECQTFKALDKLLYKYGLSVYNVFQFLSKEADI